MPKDNRKNLNTARRVKSQAQKKTKWRTTGLLALAGLLFIALFFMLSRPQAKSLDAVRLADNPSLGSASARVTIVEYADFGCTSCRAWHNAGILDQIRALYGDKVQFVWKDFPVITAQSPKAAEAGQCAFDQGVFHFGVMVKMN